MDYEALYKSKLTTAAKAAEVVKSDRKSVV